MGLGFGGFSDFSKFRIWIDDEIESESHVHSDDDTFSTGYVAGEIDGKLEIMTIEIFGLGG